MYTIIIFGLAVFCTKSVFSDDIKFEAVHHELKIGEKEYIIDKDTPYNLYQAISYCKSFGKELVSIESVAENVNLYAFIFTSLQAIPHVFWTSAFRTNSTSESWIWLNSGKSIQEFYWMPGEPNLDSANPGIKLNFGPNTPEAWWQAANPTLPHYTICQST